MVRTFYIIAVSLILVTACSDRNKPKLFSEVSSERSGIIFQNTVVQDPQNHVLNYPYYFNGGGVAVGDINNDGLADVYFSGNMVPNRLYLNKGGLVFEDITERAGVAVNQGWKTGVTMADVNQDGWLDIYVCRSAMSDSTLRTNLLFINNGNGTFAEKGAEFGVHDNSYSTHACFFDYDKDNDLDLFVLNHSLPQYAGFNRLLVNHKKQKGDKFQSKLYQNNGGRFSDVSEKAGIINNVLSFGLGVAVADVNADGWTDIYVSNDFNEEDYLYINNGDGTFRDKIREAMGHVSLFSMGSDIADINNDALPDVFTLDMLPETNERIKLSSGDDNYDKYKMLVSSGFHHQTMRNMLQLNNGDGTFSEIGQLAGVSNTDWSWAAIFSDFDGDGWKDLYVSNGYEKDYTNMQFLKFTVDERLKSQQTGAPPDIKKIIDQMPAIEVGNYLFRNNGDLTFTKKSGEWGLAANFKSNGAASADLDNDGDRDLLINAMNRSALLYRNNAVENQTASFLTVDLAKENAGVILTGTKVHVYLGDTVQYEEFSPVRGFQSAMHVPLTFGMGRNRSADSIRIIWPDGKTRVYKDIPVANTFTPRYAEAGDSWKIVRTGTPLFTSAPFPEWTHTPPDVDDFKRQYLLPRMYSLSGPKMATGDADKDGLEDVYVCGARGQSGALFMQRKNGFVIKPVAAFAADKDFQDEDALFFDADNDSDLDLYVVSGGYSFNPGDAMLQDRLYLNDGSGNYSRAAKNIPEERNAGGCVVAFDIDGDKDLDIFSGSRILPGQYPLAPKSMLLINGGKGNFTDETGKRAAGLAERGMICDANATDLNGDGRIDLVIAGEWMSLAVMINTGGQLVDETSKWIPPNTEGWWNCLTSADFDGDGDMDIIAGNAGTNNQYKVDATHPATLVHKDFNSDGQVDPFFCYYIGETSFPFASRDEALGQVTSLKPKFPDYTAYANATLNMIFTDKELEGAGTLRASLLNSVYLENKGSRFELKELPVQAQFAPVYCVGVFDFDEDGDEDIILAGNETNVRVRIGRSDANKGFVFLNDGKGNFSYMRQALSGLNFAGDVRDVALIRGSGRVVMLATQTKGPALSFVVRNKIPLAN